MQSSFTYLFFWLRLVFTAAHRLSLVAVSGGYSSLQCAGFSLWWLLFLRSTGSRHAGFSSCGTWAQQLWLMGLVALWHVGSSRTRDWTRAPCIGRWILNHLLYAELLTENTLLPGNILPIFLKCHLFCNPFSSACKTNLVTSVAPPTPFRAIPAQVAHNTLRWSWPWPAKCNWEQVTSLDRCHSLFIPVRYRAVPGTNIQQISVEWICS